MSLETEPTTTTPSHTHAPMGVGRLYALLRRRPPCGCMVRLHRHRRRPGQEIDLAAAARWGECYQELEAPHLWPALCAWVATEMYTEDNWGMPSVSSFTDEHQGHWGSWLDFAYPIIDETVDMSGWDELAKKYFNYESYARTLKYDYSVK